MKLTIIYRLETKDGTGVYRTGAAGLLDFDSSRHPMPENDTLLMTNLGNKDFCDNYHFGFISLQQLRAWFHNDYHFRTMDEHGVLLSIYDSEEVYVGHTQLCFNHNTAILQAKNNLLKFFNLDEK